MTFVNFLNKINECHKNMYTIKNSGIYPVIILSLFLIGLIGLGIFVYIFFDKIITNPNYQFIKYIIISIIIFLIFIILLILSWFLLSNKKNDSNEPGEIILAETRKKIMT